LNSNLQNKHPSEDMIVRSFLEKQENQSFFSSDNYNNLNYDELLRNSNNEYVKSVEGKKFQLISKKKILNLK